jgi:phosphodiesterase/alkaline phosphatase D-like protein
MLRTLSAVAALSLAAAPAFADEVKLNLTGMAPDTAYAMILKAAQTVCGQASAAPLYYKTVEEACVADTVNATLAKLASPRMTGYVAAIRQTTIAKR